jgi:hypothetical protein
MSPLILAKVIYASPNIVKSHLCLPLYCQVIYVYPTVYRQMSFMPPLILASHLYLP